MFCQKCGVSNDASAKFCSGCGSSLSQTAAMPVAGSTTTLQPPVPDELYRTFVGPKNQEYYLGKFRAFDAAGGSKASWNWPAFLATFYWFLYRKMWLNALLYFVVPYLVVLVIAVIPASSGPTAQSVVGILYLLYFLAYFFLPPIYANALYHKHARKKIMLVAQSGGDTQRKMAELSSRGGTSNIAVVAVVVVLTIVLLGILAAVAIPAYQDYSNRAARLRTSNAAGAVTPDAPAQAVAGPHLDSLVTGRDKGGPQVSDFGVQDTVYSTATASQLSGKVILKWRLYTVKVQGQPDNAPIEQFDLPYELVADGSSIYSLSPPTSGWPLGTYRVEVTLVDVAGKALDRQSATITVASR